MRIAIDGTQASGKTTLAIALHEIYPKVPYITEVATEVARQMGATTAVGLETILKSRSDYATFVRSIHREQLVKESGFPRFLIDSSIFRNIAYASVVLGMVPDDFDYDFRAHRYDLIFLCEPLTAYAEDGFRFKPFRSEVQIELKTLLERFNQRFLILSEDFATRKEIAIAAMSRILADS